MLHAGVPDLPIVTKLREEGIEADAARGTVSDRATAMLTHYDTVSHRWQCSEVT
jgi:hypothetical protein